MALFIQHIDIDNFKSFSGLTSIPFQTGFTTVSGPNGSGKSNIIDSVLFCLGLSTSRTLRAEKLTDLINHSSRRRDARVTITFADTEDNQAKFVIGRSIKDNRQSGYNSTYYLNGKTSTLGEIQETLSRHNISAQAYNVLMQGDVTGIINMSAMERRRIIDEIAGVGEFDRKIEAADKEIITVEQGIERSNILRGELEQRQSQLEEERQTALKYQKLREEKTELEGQIQLATYRDLLQRFRNLQTTTSEAEKEKQGLNKAMTSQQQLITQTEAELQEIALEVKRKGEDQQIALKKQIESLKGAVSRKQDTIKFGQEKSAENLQTIQKCIDETNNLKEKQTELDTAINELKQAEATAQSKVDKIQKTFDDIARELSELNEQTQDAAQQQLSIKRQLNEAENLMATLERQKLIEEGNLERAEYNLTNSRELIEAKKARLAEITAQMQKLDGGLKDADLEIDAFKAQIEQQQLLVNKSRLAAQEAQVKVSQLEREKDRLEAQKRAYDEMSLGRSIDTVMNAGIKGVFGPLGQLMSCESDVATALEVALGGRIRSIVVDNDKTAQEGIEVLKRTQAGRATFLPLNKIKGPNGLPILPDDEEIVGFAIDLCQFDDKYSNAFNHAFGDTVVMESINAARRYIGKYRMVTLDGAVFERTGAITGGSNQRQGSGLLQSAKLEQDINAIEASLKTLVKDRDQAQDTLTKAELKLDAIKQDFNQMAPSLQERKIQAGSFQREEQELTQTITKAEQDIEQFSQQTTKAKAALAEVQTKLDAQIKTVDHLQKQLAGVEETIPTEQLQFIRAQQNEIEQQLKEAEKILRSAQADTHAKQLEREFLDKGAETYTSQIETLKEANQKLSQEAIQLAEEIALIEIQIEGLIVQASQMDEELVALQAQRDEIQSKLIEQEREKFAIAQKITTLEEQITAYKERLSSIKPELAELKEALLEAGHDPEEAEAADIKDIEAIQKSIASLQRRMDALGDVNMRAIADYDEVAKRLGELSEKLNTLQREKDDLRTKMQGYEELKLKTFKDAFDAVNLHFQDIFAELSDGEGQLILTNPASPFDGGLTIEARPRGKKTLRIEAMSGGEKSLTALAFVFAFQRYMPAPFYAFDEVDMFLDGINAEKLAHMVKKQSGAAQFIVVSLRKPMLQNSDLTVGVTQRKDGVSKVTGVALQDVS